MEKSVNTLKKQLVAAVAMVLVAAIALSTSTFAWFVNNTSVEATGMHVNAVADGSLVIKGVTSSADQAYTSIGTVGTANGGTGLKVKLAPATSTDGLNFAKLGDVSVKSADSFMASWTGTDGQPAEGELVTVNAQEKDRYVLQAQYRIASVNEEADVYLSAANVTVTNGNVQAALKMSITFEKGNVKNTKVFNLGKGTVTAAGALNADSGKWSLAAPTYGDMDDTNTWHLDKVTKAEDGTATLVTVLIWYEGQDEKCFSNNVDTAGTDITLTFSKKAPAQA